MANILDPMDLKQIITLHLDGASNRRIGSVLGISRNTVNTYMQLFAASDYSLEELLRFDTAALSELFSSHTTLDTERHNELMLYFEGVNKARNHPGFTFLHHLSITEVTGPVISVIAGQRFRESLGQKKWRHFGGHRAKPAAI